MPHSKGPIYGPYRVHDIGVGGPVYAVICLVDRESLNYEELSPPYRTRNRRSANRKVASLNKRWQEEVYEHPDPDGIDLLNYWKEATN